MRAFLLLLFTLTIYTAAQMQGFNKKCREKVQVRIHEICPARLVPIELLTDGDIWLSKCCGASERPENAPILCEDSYLKKTFCP
ncbi:unnamed protein product, partial [Mesorhabditis spiculigera]